MSTRKPLLEQAVTEKLLEGVSKPVVDFARSLYECSKHQNSGESYYSSSFELRFETLSNHLMQFPIALWICFETPRNQLWSFFTLHRS